MPTLKTSPGGLAPGNPAAAALEQAAAAPDEHSGARPATPVQRCDFSELPADQCGCEHCRPDLAGPELPDVLPIAYEGSWIEAQHPGICGCGCGTHFGVGADLVCADVEPGARPRNRTWCLADHTRSAGLDGGH